MNDTFIKNFRDLTRVGIEKQETKQPDEEPVVVPKAPNFRYKNPAIDNNYAFWLKFSDPGTMRHYDDLMNILNEVEQLNSLEDIHDYTNNLKNSISYKINPGIRYWVDDLEALYYGDGIGEQYSLALPVDIMRYQTTKAKSAYESGYDSRNFEEEILNNYNKSELERVPSPNELLPKIANTFKK